MPAPISIYLIRHGESEANLNKSINAIKADHLVELSPRGQDQAVEAGTKLGAILTEPIKEGEVIAAYVSPYNRTRQTWNNVKVGLRGVLGALPAIKERESIYLRELEFGLFDGIADEELPSLFPLEYTHYSKLKQAGGEYYARMPCGESRCDVTQRVHQGFGSIHRDHEKHGVRHAIVSLLSRCSGKDSVTLRIIWHRISPAIWHNRELLTEPPSTSGDISPTQACLRMR